MEYTGTTQEAFEYWFAARNIHEGDPLANIATFYRTRMEDG